MKPELFRNRTNAGRQLAEKLAAYANRQNGRRKPWVRKVGVGRLAMPPATLLTAHR